MTSVNSTDTDLNQFFDLLSSCSVLFTKENGHVVCFLKRFFPQLASTPSLPLRGLGCIYTCNEFFSPPRYEDRYSSYNRVRTTTTTPLPQLASSKSGMSGGEEVLRSIAYYFLLPLVVILIVVCFVLGFILIVKTYRMKPLKQNLHVAIRRSRQIGHAPPNQYIQPEEVRASQIWNIENESDRRKSLPPPEVLMAARARASQMLV